MKNSTLTMILAAALALAALLATGEARAFTKYRIPIPTAWTRCAADADCVLVNFHCCGCFAGGVSTAIGAAYLDAYDRRFAKACPEFLPDAPDPLFCPQTIVCPPGAEVFCNARGRCEFGVR